MPTYGSVSAVRRHVLAAVQHGYTLQFAQGFNQRMIALETEMALQQGVDWNREPLDMLLVVDAGASLGERAEELFDELCAWLAEQGFSFEKSA